MKFNPTTEYDSIVKNIRDLTDANDQSLTLRQIARSANNYINRASHILLTYSDNKNWDDPNFSTLPQGTYDIISGDRQITMSKDEEGKEILAIRRVLVKSKDQAGTWNEVVPMDLTSNNYVLNDEVQGVPQSYDWVGQTLIWNITPNYDKTAGVKVFYQRANDYVTEADTNKEIGLPEPYQDYVVYGVAYDYAMRKGLQRKDELYRTLKDIENNMKSFMGKQSNEKNKSIQPIRVNVN